MWQTTLVRDLFHFLVSYCTVEVQQANNRIVATINVKDKNSSIQDKLNSFVSTSEFIFLNVRMALGSDYAIEFGLTVT